MSFLTGRPQASSSQEEQTRELLLELDQIQRDKMAEIEREKEKEKQVLTAGLDAALEADILTLRLQHKRQVVSRLTLTLAILSSTANYSASPPWTAPQPIPESAPCFRRLVSKRKRLLANTIIYQTILMHSSKLRPSCLMRLSIAQAVLTARLPRKRCNITVVSAFLILLLRLKNKPNSVTSSSVETNCLVF